jgi:uncharacterized ferredoxin-like protein
MERKAVEWAAYLMAAGARTAPKARGIDSILTALINSKEDLEALAKAMERQCQQKKVKIESFLRDANNVRQSSAILLIGVKGTMPKKPELPLNCGACGYQTCNEFIRVSKKRGEDFVGPLCFFQALDLGIALGSAVKMAADLNIDNRMMFTISGAAKDLGFLDADAIIGIPLSVSGKNIFFDR